MTIRGTMLVLGLLPLLLAANGQTFTWTGADPAQPTAWQQAGNWADGRLPGAEATDAVLIPGGCPAYPVLTQPLELATTSLTIAAGARLDATGQALTVGAGFVDRFDGPDLQARDQQPTGLRIEADGTLVATDATLRIRVGGLVNRGRIVGQPTLELGSFVHCLTLDAGDLEARALRLLPSAYPYPVVLRSDLRIAGDLLAAGGRLHVASGRTVRIGGSLHVEGELALDGDIEVGGNVSGGLVRVTGGRWVTLVGAGPHLLVSGGSGPLPPLRLTGGAIAEVRGERLHCQGLLIESGAVLRLKDGQRLVFGVDYREWQRDPAANLVIFAARPFIPVRTSRDLVNHGRIEGVEAVPFVLHAYADGKPWVVSGQCPPKAGVALNTPGSPLEIKGGKLLLDGKEVRPADDLDFDLLDAPAQPTLTQLKLAPVPVAEPSVDGLLNLAPGARELGASPSIGRDIYRLVDGDPATVAEFRRGVTLPGTIWIDFAQPVEVRAVRLKQAGIWAPRFVLATDTTGDGDADRVLAIADGLPSAWSTVAVPPTRCHRIWLRAMEIQGGWEQSAPTLGELEVYASPESAAALPPLPANPPAAALPRLTVGDAIAVEWPTVPAEGKLLRLLTTDLWMFGITGGQDDLPKVPLAEHPAFLKTLDDIQAMGADGTLLFIEANMQAFWPSVHFRSVTNEQYWQARDKAALPTIDVKPAPPLPAPALADLPNQRDLLRELVDAFHARGMQVHMVFLGRFPGCYVGPKDRDAWEMLFAEIAARNVDGISLTADEAYFGLPHPDGEKRPPDDPVRQAFRDRFGPEAELPKDIWQRSVDYKRWVVYSYEQHALRLKRYGETIHAINPRCATFTVIGSHPISVNNRITYGLAYDVIGQLAGLDYLGSDYLPRETRLYTAANAPRAGCMENFVPRSVREGIVSVLQGARLVAYYRYNYIASQDSRDHRVREFAFMDAMMASGATRAQSVTDVACLVSRASEDWWDNDHGTNWLAWNPEAKRGFWSHRAINQLLDEGGIAYDMLYLDRPETLGALSRYGLILLPFPYAIGDDAMAAIEQAHAAGAKVLILQRQGEVGPYGAPHDPPALQRLIEAGRADGSVRFLDRDLLAWETERDFPRQFVAELDALLGPRRQLRSANPGDGIASYLFTNGRDGRYLALVNWNAQSRATEVGLQLDAADYHLLTLSSETPTAWHAGRIGDRDRWTAAELASFAVELAPGEVRLIAIQPAATPWAQLPP